MHVGLVPKRMAVLTQESTADQRKKMPSDPQGPRTALEDCTGVPKH